MLTVFFGVPGSLFVAFLEHKRAITLEVYCETVKAYEGPSEKKGRLLTVVVVLIHNNGCSHESKVTHVKWAKYKFE